MFSAESNYLKFNYIVNNMLICLKLHDSILCTRNRFLSIRTRPIVQIYFFRLHALKQSNSPSGQRSTFHDVNTY